MNILSKSFLLLCLFYWGYLLSPFSNLNKRNYLRLIKEDRFLLIHLFLSLMLAFIGFNRLNHHYDFNTFCFTPLLFILMTKAIDFIFQKRYNRVFILRMRGNNNKIPNKEVKDLIASYILILSPIVIPMLIALYMNGKF